MYSRNYNRTQRSENPRYNPPPGYKGNAFSGKHHKPTDEIGLQYSAEKQPNAELYESGSARLDFENFEPRRPQYDRSEPVERREEGIRQENTPVGENQLTCRGEEKDQSLPAADRKAEDHTAAVEKHPLYDLIESLRGKIGTEELIILMVMLLVASDGIGVEVLILALALLAG